ncbi:type VI secretion system baseplate subunit TssE [Azospira inquinata]|uniref:Type VI secretion system baseplate subunit TssE n=1 Tax=Azospira inquinata TaxID=2785627 RepID=A0A975XV64_9RHOO|nr:type VI secretion system baseplate subunit TssE [Azospira inquinata]QWT45150.1 type VI secretion system baseplate subunit TssE [Azospira inquinata]QWT49517.1 type VI secretion system baseplate subunit TssE [Azospira inquinata]
MRLDKQQQAIQPSFLDRLLDDSPKDSEERADSFYLDLRRYRQIVARDLEALLNTRRSDPDEKVMDYDEASRTMLAYGVMDLNSLCLQDPDDRSRLQEDLLRSIERFEPRLKRVRVSLDLANGNERSLRFRVAAVLAPYPNRPTVTFDATLQLASNAYRVQDKD